MLCFQADPARRRSVAASICHTIKAFCKRLLALLYACLLYNRQDCCHSPGIVWACLLCNQQRRATIQPPGSASVEGSPQQDKAAQRPRPPDGTQIPAIFPLVWLSLRGLYSISRGCLRRVCGAFQPVSLRIAPCSRCQSGRLCRACQAAVIRCPLKNPARNVEFLAKIAIK